MEPELFNILRGYGSLTPPRRMVIPHGLASSTIHSFFLESLLLNVHFQEYPPSDQYQRTFWKWAIECLESLELDEACAFEEIDPRIYEHYLSLLPSSGLALGTSKAEVRSELCPGGLELRRPPSSSYITHYWSPKSDGLEPGSGRVNLAELRTVTLHESRTMIEHGTTGMRTWLASFVLARYVVQHQELLKSTCILELGSGIGFLGITIAQLLQSNVPSESVRLWMSDVNESVLKRCRENLQLSCNGLQSDSIQCISLDWFDALDPDKQELVTHLLREEIDADLILGADIIFDPSLIPPLAEVLSIALQSKQNQNLQKIAIIAATIRNEETFVAFLKELEAKHLRVGELASCRGDSIIQDVDTGEIVKVIQITHPYSNFHRRK